MIKYPYYHPPVKHHYCFSKIGSNKWNKCKFELTLEGELYEQQISQVMIIGLEGVALSVKWLGKHTFVLTVFIWSKLVLCCKLFGRDLWDTRGKAFLWTVLLIHLLFIPWWIYKCGSQLGPATWVTWEMFVVCCHWLSINYFPLWILSE